MARSPRIWRILRCKSRCQAAPRATEPTELVDSVADRPTGAARRMVIAEATRSIWRPYAGVGPVRQASSASKPPAARLSRHRAGHLLSLASSRFLAHRARHRRNRRSAELACARRRPFRQPVALVALPPPSPPFPPYSAHDFTFGKSCLALRRRGYALAGVPPWPLPWPCLVGTALAI